jgi:crotonobetainyl-CoA:carnitine CoA-transferase CaiB-like acyl-CoA transferase
MTTMFLADMGADVIKIEVGNGIGDAYKLVGTSIDAGGLRFGSSSAIANRGKRSISVNSKTPEGIRVIKHLATDADVFVQNMRPGVIDKLGVGPDDLMAINPNLIYCSISGFGQTGPWSNKMTVRVATLVYAHVKSLLCHGADTRGWCNDCSTIRWCSPAQARSQPWRDPSRSRPNQRS